MSNLILSACAIAAWLTSIAPPIVESRKISVLLLRVVLSAVIGGCMGTIFGRAVAEVFLK